MKPGLTKVHASTLNINITYKSRFSIFEAAFNLYSMKQFFTIIAVLAALMVNAQPDPIGNFNKHVIEKWTHDYIRVSQYRVKGSPYLLGQSFNGDITMKSGVVTVDKKILYDIYDQKVGVDLDKKFVAPDGEVSGFFIQLSENFGGEKLNFINAANLPKVNLKGYLNIIADGSKFAFLRQYRIRLVADPAEMYSKDIKLFEQYYDYYIYNRATAELNKIKLKDKDVLEALGNPSLPEKFDLYTALGVRQAVEAMNT